jgi:hypothetical protein
MKQLLAVMNLLVFLSTASVAQEINNNVVDKKFVAVTGALISATIVDIEGTFAVRNSLKNNPDYYFHERNPLLRPFVNAGRPATYAILGGMDAGVLALSYKMKKSANPTIRRLWLLPPVMLAIGHAFAGASNYRLSRLR